MKVIILGGAGNLGQRLVSRGLANGHGLTVLVRDRARFADRWRSPEPWPFEVVEGDAADRNVLRHVIAGHDVLVNAAGNVTDGERFAALVDAIAGVGAEVLPAPHRMWFLAGAAILDVPHTNRIGITLPGVPPIYKWHEVNWRRLESSNTDWSLVCPGPMIPSATQAPRADLRISCDKLPYDVGRWTRWVPGIALSLMMKAKLPELIVSYEDVAELIMTHLLPGDPYSCRRVGVALPKGERGNKPGWA
jgi:putative NADH-flavin reductase